MNAGAPKVVQRIPFPDKRKAEAYLYQLGARYRKIDEYTGLPLWKTNANVVFRVGADGKTLEILSNCTC